MSKSQEEVSKHFGSNMNSRMQHLIRQFDDDGYIVIKLDNAKALIDAEKLEDVKTYIRHVASRSGIDRTEVCECDCAGGGSRK